jgi:hypothetical protein
MAHRNYTGNLYNDWLGRLGDRIPKAVVAAIAVSYATSGGDYPQNAQENVSEEWVILYENKIVPQRPPQYVFDLAAKAKQRKEVPS